VNCRSYTDEYPNSRLFRDAVIAILAVIGKQERIGRRDRVSAAIARLRRAGASRPEAKNHRRKEGNNHTNNKREMALRGAARQGSDLSVKWH